MFALRLALLFLLLLPVGAAQPKPLPRHDPADQPFRRAPMAESARSIVVNLGTNLHAAFDAELGRVHTVWRGGPLNLWGPPYSHSKAPFICDFAGEPVYTFPQVVPWSSGGKPLEVGFKGIQTREGGVQFEYRLGNAIQVLESIEGIAEGKNWTARRRFEFPQGVNEPLSYVAFAESGADLEAGNPVQARGTNGVAWFLLEPSSVHWSVQRQKQRYKTELITDAGTEKGNPVRWNEGMETRLLVEIPRQSGAFSFAIVMSGERSPLEIPQRTSAKPKVFAGTGEKRSSSGDPFFRVEHFPLPSEAELLITGMDWLNERDLAICTWLGEIYIVENASGPIERATYRRFARGLNEPLGLSVARGQIFVVQKGELTGVLDSDRDGEADRFESICDDWGYSGNYHSYSFGPLVTGPDEFMVFITGQRGRADLANQGCALRVKAGGNVEKVASGLRVPHGWGTFQDEIFFTDNQGNWIGACKLNHLQPGKFYGFHLPGTVEKGKVPTDPVEPPVLWFPRSLSPSTSGFDTAANGAFGPFDRQMFIGDFQNSIVMRACLEKVKGKWQGAVFPFAKGFLSGVNRLRFGADGKLYVGGGKRTWSTAAPKEYSLDRVSYTGKLPFEVAEVHALTDGFELRFTKALEAGPAKDAENYLVKQFTYEYHEEYGSPEFDHHGKVGATETPVESIELSEDHKTVRLHIPNLKTGFATSFQLAVNSAEDEDLRNDQFYYTLNNKPD